MRVVMLTFPKLTQLDLTGPYEVLARFPEVKVELVWKTLDPIEDAFGLRLVPTTTFAECAQADVLFVPGGPGQLMLMQDEETLHFLRHQAAAARWITSVCTGSLVHNAAGSRLRPLEEQRHRTNLVVDCKWAQKFDDLPLVAKFRRFLSSIY